VSTDLVSWLRAQLDADAEAARLSNTIDPAPWYEDVDYDSYTNQRQGTHGAGLVYAADNVALWDREQSCTLSMTAPTAVHVALHDPARVLADAEAKRRLIGNHQADGKGCCRTCAHWTTDWVDGHKVDRLAYEGVRAPCLTLRLLGLPYADRPGYDESWRP
jgi:hypothetical protein